MSKGKKKRETTRWRFEYAGDNGTYIKVGRVYNIPKDEVPEDIVRYAIKSASPGGSMNYGMTVDEALALANGLSRVVMEELAKDSVHVRKRYQ